MKPFETRTDAIVPVGAILIELPPTSKVARQGVVGQGNGQRTESGARLDTFRSLSRCPESSPIPGFLARQPARFWFDSRIRRKSAHETPYACLGTLAAAFCLSASAKTVEPMRPNQALMQAGKDGHILESQASSIVHRPSSIVHRSSFMVHCWLRFGDSSRLERTENRSFGSNAVLKFAAFF
jgi:hypothetical protein